MVGRRQFISAGIAPLAAACRRKRGSGFNGYAFVANEDGKAIAVVDLVAFALVRHVRLDDAPTAVIGHDGVKPEPSVYVLTPRSGHILQIHSERLEVVRRVGLGTPAISMRLSPDHRFLWVLCADRRLMSVDLPSFRISSRIKLPADPVDFDLSRQTGLAAVSYGSAGFVSQLDLKSGSAAQTARLSDQLGIVRYRSDGKALLVANKGGRMLTVLDALQNRVVTHLPLAIRPDSFCFNKKDEGQLFISGEGEDAVVVVYPYYVPQVAETVLAGDAPGAMASSNTHLFIANPQAGDISILHIERRQVVAVADVGAEPAHIVVTPDDQYVLVLNRQSGDMSVIRTAGIVPNRRKTAALFTIIPVGSKPVSAAVMAVT